MSACPKCRDFDTSVKMTRKLRNGWVRRDRVCMDEACRHTFRTLEIPVEQVELEPGAEDMREVKQWKK